MRTLILALVLFLVASGCQGGPPIVTAIASPTRINSGGTSAVQGTARTNQGMAATIGLMTFSAPLGRMAPPSRNTDNTGQAQSTFQAPVVDRETPVIVTASFGGGSGTVTITVNPPVVDCQFHPYQTGPDDPTDIVTISPQVVPNNAWKWIYTLTVGSGHAGGNTAGIRTASVTFQKPVKLTSSSGAVMPADGQDHLLFTVSNPTAPFTITAEGDAEPGGTASWDIIDPPPNIRHATCTTTGPM